ncbi:hypothetical protein ACQY0O_006718 [Thecaphora frezii]
MPKYSVDAAARLIQQHRVRSILGIGFMVREIITSNHRLESLRSVMFRGSTSSKEIPREAKKKLADGYVGQGYGATETNGGVCGLGVDDFVARPTSTGLPPPVCRVLVMNPDTHTEVGPGEVGEVWISGPCIALGYWGRAAATSEVFTQDGFYRTGDLGRKDADGFLYILDRSKHIIIRGGENISGPQVEDAIYADERILDCVAVPVPDERLGERVAVVVVPHEKFGEHQWPTPQEVVETAKRELPRHAVPEYVWIRRRPLERNANGKVERKRVKDDMLAWLRERVEVDNNELRARL